MGGPPAALTPVIIVWRRKLALGCPRHCGQPTAAFGPRRCCVVSNIDIRLPTSLWAALLRRSYPLVIVRCRRSTLGCPCRCGQPCCGICVPSSWPGVERRCWAAHVIVGSCYGVGVPLSSSGVEHRPWGAHVVVSSLAGASIPSSSSGVERVVVPNAAVMFAPCRCVVWVWDLSVVVGLAESGGWRH